MDQLKKKGSGVRKLSSDGRWAAMFLAVALVLFAVFTLYPLFYAVKTSFLDYKPFGSDFVGLKNYEDTLKNALFWKSVRNTLVYTAAAVPMTLLLSFLVAVMIQPFTRKIQAMLKAMFYLPLLASGVALSVVWQWIYDSSPSGLLNIVFSFLGLPQQNWLNSSKTAMLSLIIMALLSGLGQNIIIYSAALMGIDNSYYEAAEIDGARFFAKVQFIVLPAVKPTTLFLTVTGVINSFQVFMNAYMLTGGGPDNNTNMVGLLIFNNAFKYNEFGLACAQAVILTIIIGSISILQFKMTGADVEY